MAYHRFQRTILMISLGVIFLLVILLSLAYHQNKAIERDIVIQYAIEQKFLLTNLDEALKNKDNPEVFIRELIMANGILYHNIKTTGNGTPIGQHGNIPWNLFYLNQHGLGLVNSLIFKAINSNVNNETVSDLEEFRDMLYRVVEEIDYNTLLNKNSKEIYNALIRASKVIEETNK